MTNTNFGINVADELCSGIERIVQQYPKCFTPATAPLLLEAIRRYAEQNPTGVSQQGTLVLDWHASAVNTPVSMGRGS